MEFDEIDDKSSPASWPTCDTANLQEVSGVTENKEKQQNQITKKYLKKMLSEIRRSLKPSCRSPSELTNYINSIFYDENIEILCEAFKHHCCDAEKHNIRCLKKWKTIQNQLIELSNKAPKQPKLIFSIKKRQNQTSRLLLSDTQPYWIHKLFLQSYLVLGNN